MAVPVICESVPKGQPPERSLVTHVHPEVDGPQLKLWLDAHTDNDPVTLGIDPDQFLADTIREEPAARDRAARLVAAFLRPAR